jgi:HAD superfamily hydrolase (TIGR01662 family)
MLALKWIFFDMGGVLIDDEPAMLHFYRGLYDRCREKGCLNSHDEIFALREELLGQGDGRHWITVGKKLLGDEWHDLYTELSTDLRQRHVELNIPYPGVSEMLDELSKKYKIGLAANQFSECRDTLVARDWLKYFSILGISEDMGLRKPDPEFFRRLLEQSRAAPEDCVMIGDRIDNDIVPAKALGMRTIWFRKEPDYNYLSTGDDFAKSYAESRRRMGVKLIEPKNESETPDYSAYEPVEILEAIEYLSTE